MYWRFYWSRDAISQVSPFTRSSVTDHSVHWLLRVKSFVVSTGSAALKFIRFQIICWFVSEAYINVANSIWHSHSSVAVCLFEPWNPITHYLKIHTFAVYCENITKLGRTHMHTFRVCFCVFMCVWVYILCAQNVEIFHYIASRTK